MRYRERVRRIVLLAGLLVGCSSYGSDDAPRPPPIADAGGEATAPAERAVHLAPDGRDFAEGTKDAPVATFRRAFELAAASGASTVYACAATYDENVVVTAPIRIVGDRACRTWAPSTTRARLAPYAGVALRIAKTSNVVVEGMQIAGAADHTVPGTSAVGVFVAESQDVVLRRVEVRAGFGIAGADGAPRSNHGAAVTCTCADGTSSTGGSGAVGTTPAKSGSASPPLGIPNAGTSSASSCTAGGAGADASAASGGDGATSPLAITFEAIERTAGANGRNGAPGQGGGGGGASTSAATAGGGGGCGGCGGAGGGGGTSGGSSIALVSFASTVQIEDAALVASDGAPGGAGGDGQSGQPGALGGIGECSGGAGGSGANGGGGGGGAGGHSFAIVHVGAAPVVRTTTTTAGKGGAPGPGGATNGAAGASGTAGAVHAM